MAQSGDRKRECLICTKDAPGMMSVFGSARLQEMVAEFLNITVSAGDPKHICEGCYELLLKADKWRKRAQMCEHTGNFYQEQEERKAKDLGLQLGGQRTDYGETSVKHEHNSDQDQQTDSTCSSTLCKTSVKHEHNLDQHQQTDSTCSSTLCETSVKHEHNSDQDQQTDSTCSSTLCETSVKHEHNSDQHQQTDSTCSSTLCETSVKPEHSSDQDQQTDSTCSSISGSLPPETTDKGSATQRQSKNLPVHSKSAILQSEGNSCYVSALIPAGSKRQQARAHPKSLTPSKHRKADIAEPQTATKPGPCKPFLDDSVCVRSEEEQDKKDLGLPLGGQRTDYGETSVKHENNSDQDQQTDSSCSSTLCETSVKREHSSDQDQQTDSTCSSISGSLPPETTDKGSATQRQSKNLPVHSKSAILQSEGNSCYVSALIPAGSKRQQARAHPKPLTPSKHRKADIAEPQTATKPGPSKPFSDDSVCVRSEEEQDKYSNV